MLSQVRGSFPDIYNHATQMYSGVSPLVYLYGKETVIINSHEGVHQGDPLGSALFSMAFHPHLSSLQSQHQKVIVLAYLDDVFLLGTSKKVLTAPSDLSSSLANIGLKVAENKCEIYCPSQLVFQAIPASNTSPVAQEGIILGTPIGEGSFVNKKSCYQFADSGGFLCEQLPGLEDPQAAMLLLRHCHISRMNNLARIVPPRLL